MTKETPFITRHYANILRSVTKDLWQELDLWQKNVISNDEMHVSASFNWFDRTVKSRALAIYEDPNRFENDPISFLGAR